eukprot:symbB.v1.2.010494.t1/scaffold647.1/size176639/2
MLERAEAGNELLSSIREKYSDAFHVAVPRSFSNERAQNSVILLRRNLFAEPKEALQLIIHTTLVVSTPPIELA